MVTLRHATVSDHAELLPRTRALNQHEGIELSEERLGAALRTLLESPDIGGAWLIAREGRTIGYAIVTYGFDLEFSGRDATLTELFVDPSQRGLGSASAALDLLMPELSARGVRALHLQVRPDNPALRLYERQGFALSPRRVMTRLLA
jgi:ribosomal protein S18 acetylase RimI-like enzyme